jgi:protein O-mannosyl-transferase
VFHSSPQPISGLRGPATKPTFGFLEQRPLVAALLLFAATLLLYAPLLNFPYLNYDDPLFVTANPQVNSGLSWAGVLWAFSAAGAPLWHPLTWLSHMADVQLFGLDPRAPHLENVLLHALNATLLFLVLRRATSSYWRSLLVACLFALHPVNVESVAWISERKNLLSTLFWLLTLGAYAWYVARPNWLRYCASLLMFALALMSKSMVVTLPFLLLLLDYWPLRRLGSPPDPALQPGVLPDAHPSSNTFLQLAAEKVPFLICSVIASVLTVQTQKAAGAMNPLAHLAFGQRTGSALGSYVRYISKLFWPTRLAVAYPHPAFSLHLWSVVASFLLLGGITFAALLSRRKYLVVGWLWFLGTLVPVIGVVQVGSQAMADRYAYTPYIGLFIAIVWGAADALAQVLWIRRSLVLVSICWLLALAAVTRRQIWYWQSDFALWSHAVAVTSNNFEAHTELGELFDGMGKPDAALAQYYAALACPGVQPVYYYNLGTHLQQHGKFDDAVRCYRIAIHSTDFQDILFDSYNNLGMAQLHLGNNQEAQQDFITALRIDPRQFTPYLGLSKLALLQGNYAQAASLAARSLQIAPSALGYVRQGQAFEHQERLPEALAAYRDALKLSPNLAEAQEGLSNVTQQLAAKPVASH